MDRDHLLMTLRHVRGLDGSALLDVMERFRKEGTNDLYALANALTALARDTDDPDLRWQRETMGAGVFARLRAPRRAPSRTLLQPH